MKIVVAMDSFKGSLTALEACEVTADAIRQISPENEIIIKPMADGGEGTAAAMIKAANGRWIPKKVMGPLPDMEVEAGFAWFERDRSALVEMATASGIQLLTKEQLNPYKTTTYGTGQLIKAALKKRPRKIYLAVGGSATVDGGVGAAMALGWKFLDEKNNSIEMGGTGLEKIAKIIKPDNLAMPDVKVFCDVDNPLCGEYGAAKVYCPQKGATPEMVEQLEKNLSHLADVVSAQLGKDIKNIPGTGAAGGLSAGAIAFMDAKLVSGIEEIIQHSHLKDELESADWVITGEGKFDDQSCYGKVVAGIAKIAAKSKTSIAVLAGQVDVSPEKSKPLGIIYAISCKHDGMSVEYAIENAKSLLHSVAQRFAEKYIS
jgi:glycerate kinase